MERSQPEAALIGRGDCCAAYPSVLYCERVFERTKMEEVRASEKERWAFSPSKSRAATLLYISKVLDSTLRLQLVCFHVDYLLTTPVLEVTWSDAGPVRSAAENCCFECLEHS